MVAPVSRAVWVIESPMVTRRRPAGGGTAAACARRPRSRPAMTPPTQFVCHRGMGGGRRLGGRCLNYVKQEVFDPGAAQEVVNRLGPDTFSKNALALTTQ